MKEEFLHYLWKYRLYDADRLADTEGNMIIVLHPGEYNHDSGPDFFNARIAIGGTEWAGNVEIHTSSSHFDLHGHQNDPAFNNVILHVVASNDKRVYNSRGEELLTVELVFDHKLFDKYLELVNNPVIIACQDEIGRVDRFLIKHWLNTLVIERLQQKSELILKILAGNGNDWEETFFRMLTRYFGFRVNSAPFEILASELPFRIIRKHTDNRFQVEALLFGTAGMLETGLFKEALSDEYYLGLVREYNILSAKYSLKHIHGWLWKFSKLRPANFPTVRISQLATMLSSPEGFFSKALETDAIGLLRGLFEVTASEYWNDHYIFGKKSINVPKSTGAQAADILLINAVIPVIFVYGMKRDRSDIREKAISLLEEIGPETNLITQEWAAAGIESDSALYSQALIQLRNCYCRKRRCLDCRIGNILISSGARLKDQSELLLEP
jgi:hypothetical protein